MGKPRGLRTARKHVKNRRTQVWADLDYKKAHLGTRWKANPFGGASHAKGIVLEKVGYFYIELSFFHKNDMIKRVPATCCNRPFYLFFGLIVLTQKSPYNFFVTLSGPVPLLFNYVPNEILHGMLDNVISTVISFSDRCRGQAA